MPEPAEPAGLLPPPEYVVTDPHLRQVAEWLLRQPRVAVDTEGNSMYAYHEQMCLLQFSAEDRDVIVDPLALDDLAPLQPLFEDPAIEKVFHAAEYDLISLYRDFGWECQNVFDTMIAARTLGWQKVGLANVLESMYGITLDKRYQRANWGARPISPPMLDYARLDTHYLLDLRDRLYVQLAEQGYLADAEEDFERVARGAVRLARQQHENNGRDGLFWRLAHGRRLNNLEATRLMLLHAYREKVAEARNAPPFKVLNDDLLLRMAIHPPANEAELAAMKGINRDQAHIHARGLLNALDTARRTPPPPRPASTRPPPDYVARYDALKAWRKARAAERNVEPDVIVNREVLEALAAHPVTTLAELETIDSLGPVRRKRYGAELLRVLAEAESNA